MLFQCSRSGTHLVDIDQDRCRRTPEQAIDAESITRAARHRYDVAEIPAGICDFIDLGQLCVENNRKKEIEARDLLE
jgi:hypothetical protein